MTSCLRHSVQWIGLACFIFAMPAQAQDTLQVYCQAEIEAPAGARVHYNDEANKTVIVFERIEGAHTLCWQEGAQ